MPSPSPSPHPSSRFTTAPPARYGIGRLVILSDQLPRSGDWNAEHTAALDGSLSTAVAPLFNDRRGVWIGVGERGEELAGAIQSGGSSLRPVTISPRDRRDGYHGFGGEVLWPLFHGLPGECRFEPAFWQAYRRINRRFARTAARTLTRSAEPGDRVWVHDPLLMNVVDELRRQGVAVAGAFFLHLPFPGPELFLRLPWRQRVLAGLLAHRHLGFQSERDVTNFVDCVHALVPAATSSLTADGQVELAGSLLGRSFATRAGAFPIGIDHRAIGAIATRPEVLEQRDALRAFHRDRHLLLGIDPLRRTQGVLEKLAAFAELLSHWPELQGRVSLLQIVLPDRDPAPRQLELRREIERRVGEIDGRFARVGWQPVHYRYTALDPGQVVAHYRAADVALLTPLREGMNLVAKQYCAAQLEERGALVLSEFAGAAPELANGAVLVNPHAVAPTARAIARTLRLSDQERVARMRRMRQSVSRHDVVWWADAFLRSWTEPARAASDPEQG